MEIIAYEYFTDNVAKTIVRKNGCFLNRCKSPLYDNLLKVCYAEIQAPICYDN